MKTTVEISDALLREARRVARQQGRTVRQLIEAGLRHVVREEQRGGREFHLREAAVGGRGLREEVRHEDWRKILEFAYEERG